MKGTTHLAGGILTGEILLTLTSGADASAGTYIAVCAGAALGSLTPDIDAGQSTISNRNLATKMTAYALNSMFSHRGIVHSPFICAILTVIISVIVPVAIRDIPPLAAAVPLIRQFGLSFGAGYISHLILDTLNPGGISWLAPIKKSRYSIANIPTNSIRDWLTGAVLAIIALFFATKVLDMIRLEEIYTQYFDTSLIGMK